MAGLSHSPSLIAFGCGRLQTDRQAPLRKTTSGRKLDVCLRSASFLYACGQRLGVRVKAGELAALVLLYLGVGLLRGILLLLAEGRI